MEQYVKQRDYSLEIQNNVIELKLRAERRLGELIKETVRPGNPQLLQDETIGRLPQGVSRTQSHRYQQAANVPEPEFETHLERVKTAGGLLTTTGVASRANIPEQQRRRFYLYIDEFQTFTSTATESYEQILSRARKYRLALILAHQQTGQIPTDLLRDIIGNVSTMVSFTVSHADATKFSKEFLTEQYDYKENKLFLEPTAPAEFITLKVGQAYCRMAGEAFKIKTFPITEKGNPEMAERVIARQQKVTQPSASAGRTAEEPAKESPQSKPATEDDIFSGDPGQVF
ncbi:type IV secretory system conjugative DNA transfer family protein [candidate division KSB1 bacterium]|nr:type IV secretory system conjugative DNA transfer family protein [candidate division KSB1 bacterium]